MAVDWRLLQQSNPLADFEGGYDRGRARAGDRIVSDAMGRYGDNPLAAADEIARVDPRLGMGLRNDFRRDQAAEAARLEDLDEETQGRAREGLALMGRVVTQVRGRSQDPTRRRSEILAVIDGLDQRGAIPPEQAAALRAEAEAMTWDDAGIDRFMTTVSPFMPAPAARPTVRVGDTLVYSDTGEVAFSAPVNPLDEQEQRARIASLEAQAARARRPAASSGGGRGGGSGGGGATYSDVPAGARVVR